MKSVFATSWPMLVWGFAGQVALPIVYKGQRLDFEYRMDIVVEPGLVLEIKSVEHLLPVHEAQLLT